MKIASDFPRRLVALIWGISACIFLWFINHAKAPQFTFESFFLFSFMLMGGGASYHFLVELLTTLYTEQNKGLWFKLLRPMIGLMLILLTAGGLILLDKFCWPRNGLLALLSIFAGYIGLGLMSSKVEKAFRAIRTTPP